MSRHRTTATLLAALLVGTVSATADAAVPRLVFPVVARVSYTDDFGAPRGTGRHEGNDIMAARKAKVVAVEPGTVTKWTRSANAGCMLFLHGRSGTDYLYIHLNNDRKMRNDTHDNSTCVNGIAYAKGLRNGQTVRAGQLIAFVGDSGDADGIATHLHFELHPNGRRAVSPYKWLRSAWHHLYARPTASVTTLRLSVVGRVVSVNTDLEPDRVRVRVAHVVLSNGWWMRPARDVTFAVPAGSTVQRRSSDGAVAAASFAEVAPGQRVTVATADFPQTLLYARARPARHVAAAILIRE